jgi:predicted Rossmann fold nucleotide-binding protein DprA/Smf involved in DNA uptake
MKIAIVGNRTGWTEEEVHKELVSRLFTQIYGNFESLEIKDIEIISGGAEGVDTFAQTFSKEYGLKITILYPNPFRPSPQRYYERNQDIVDMADALIAFQNNSHRSGTQSTINRARKKGIPVIVIGSE